MRLLFVFLMSLCFPLFSVEKVPAGDAQLKSELQWFVAGKNKEGQAIKYCGQQETNGKLRLTASNGYFSKGLRAKGESKYPFIKTPMIVNNYAYLEGWNSKEQSLRWHAFFQKAGELTINVELHTKAVAEIEVRLDDERINFTTEKGKNSYQVKLGVKNPGKGSLSLKMLKSHSRDLGKLYGMDLFGPAVKGAKLLRARWRPGAVHTRFTSSTTDDSFLWVMRSKSLRPASNYSPITTPFGYYGTSFDPDRRAKEIMNFSMWSKLDVPIDQMTHLIAVGSLKADFGGFGHEGTGVKLRGDWKPLAHRPEVLTQALRVEYGEKYASYYGYFLDQEGNWQLFCCGRKFIKSKRDRKALWPGAFVEVPGPPQVQRSGDLIREVHRQGWVLDSNKKWHVLDQMAQGKASNANKGWGKTSDGWFIMKMGGMEHFDYENSSTIKSSTHTKFPEFLQGEKLKQLFAMPAEFGDIKVERSKGETAKVIVNMKKAGPKAKAIIYYGKKDYMTFAPRKLHGTERKSSVLNESGSWTNSVELKSLTKGKNSVALKSLESGTAYWLRVLIINEDGRQWSESSIKF